MKTDILSLNDSIIDNSKGRHIISVLNYIVLFSYATMLMFQFKRYIDAESNSDLFLATLIIEGVFIAIDLFKIVYYFRFNKFYSIISVVSCGLFTLFYYYKFEGNLSLFLSARPAFLITLIIAISMYQIPFDKIARVFLLSVGTFFFIRMFGAIVGILPMNKYVRGTRGATWDFGFSHYNVVLAFFFNIVLVWLYIIRANKNKYKHAIVILILTITLYFFTTSRTASFVLMGGLLFIIASHYLEAPKYDKIRERLFSVVRPIMMLSPTIAVVVSIFGTILYNFYYTRFGRTSYFITFLARFRNFSIDCVRNGIHLPFQFFYKDKYATTSFNWLLGGVTHTKASDNACHSLIINNGLIIFLVLFLLFQLWAIRSYKKKNDTSLLIIAMLSVVAIMESHIYNYMYNLFVMLPFATWGACESELYSSVRESLPIKVQIKSVAATVRSKRFPVLFASLVYACAFMVFVVSISYNMLTNVVSNSFFWWMFATVIYLLIMYFLLSGSRYLEDTSISIKSVGRKYAVPVAISVVIFIAGCVTVMVYALNTTTTTLDIQDPRIANGLELNMHPYYRQVFRSDKNGLKKISIYLDDYTNNMADIAVSVIDNYTLSGGSYVLPTKEYTKGEPIVIDCEFSSVKKGRDYCVFFYDACKDGEDIPVLNRIVYTFIEDIPIMNCILLTIPMFMLIDLTWIIFGISILIKDRKCN